MFVVVSYGRCRGVLTDTGTCSGPKPESYPRTYPNPRISEDNPGPDPLDPGDHRPGPRVPPAVPPEAPGVVFTQSPTRRVPRFALKDRSRPA